VAFHSKQVKTEAKADTLIAPLADSYQWFFKEKEIAGATSQELVVRNTGVYHVKTSTNGCEASSVPAMHTVQLAQTHLRISPNPVPAALSVSFASVTNGTLRLSIRDQLGRLVQPVLSLQKENTVLESTLPATTLPPGLYILEAQLGKEVHRVKFVKL
jgi:hypothetical protein